MLVHAWKQLSSWFFWILKEQNKNKILKYFYHENKTLYLKRKGKDRGTSILAFLTMMHSILKILTYTSEYMSEIVASTVIVPQHSLTFFNIPDSCGTWNSKGQLGCSSWTAGKNRASKMECSRGIVYKATSYSCCVTEGEFQTSDALRGNSRGWLSKIFETGHPQFRHKHTKPSLLFH